MKFTILQSENPNDLLKGDSTLIEVWLLSFIWLWVNHLLNEAYNPCLALRQFGYARRDGPHEVLIQGITFDYESDTQSYRQRFVRAWGMVNKVDSKALGKKNSIHMEPYLKWIRARAQNLMMPYTAIF